MRQNPCQECSKRVLACHDSCPDYQGWLEQKKEISRRRDLEKDLDSYYFSYRKPRFRQ